MKGITKRIAPKNFLQWVNDFEKLNNTTTYSWKYLRDINDDETHQRIVEEFGYCFEKKDLRLALLQEQGFICCYCCKLLTNDKSVIIEHFEPRSKSSEIMFNYGNLHICCSGIEIGDDGKQIKPKHCGDAKGDKLEKINENGNVIKIISPLEKDEKGFFVCEKSFLYDLSGNIFETENNNDALFTIEQLKLQHPQLIKARLLALEEAFPGITEIGYIDLDEEEAMLYLEHYTNPHLDNEDDEYKFEPFCNVVIYFLNLLLHAKTIS